jgi:hypothetical protein
MPPVLGSGHLRRPDRSFCPAGKGGSDRRYQDGVQPLGRESFLRAKRVRVGKFLGALCRRFAPPRVVPRPPSIRIAKASRSKERCSSSRAERSAARFRAHRRVGCPRAVSTRPSRVWRQTRCPGIKVPRRRGVTPGQGFREPIGGNPGTAQTVHSAIEMRLSEYGGHTYSGGVYHRSFCGHAPSQGGMRTDFPQVRQ